MQDVSLDQAAEAMGMSSFYFSRFFRTSYNQTFLEYLTAYRIDRAVELLRRLIFRYGKSLFGSAIRMQTTSRRCSSGIWA